jgi:hypothetical protein
MASNLPGYFCSPLPDVQKGGLGGWVGWEISTNIGLV